MPPPATRIRFLASTFAGMGFPVASVSSKTGYISERVPSTSPPERRSLWLRSVSGIAVDHVLQRQPALEALDLREHVLGERPRIGNRGVVRRDEDVRMRPQWARGRERLGREHVEARAR